MTASTMTQGYPAEADVITYLAGMGIEIPTENAQNYYGEFRQFTYGVVAAVEWALVLSIECPSSTTFNVRGGKYLYNGTVKTYTPGAAVDPTDNDTTYVWLNPDNTISSAVDGTGWPEIEHLKLAEIVVDSDGVITAVTDLRGQTFMRSYTAEAITQVVAERVLCYEGEVLCYEDEIVTG